MHNKVDPGEESVQRKLCVQFYGGTRSLPHHTSTRGHEEGRAIRARVIFCDVLVALTKKRRA